MKESVAVAKEADAKKGVSPTRSDNSILRLRDEPERQLDSLRGVIGDIRRNGGTPSVESIATELSSMPTAQRAPALLALQQMHGNRYVQRVVSGIQAKLKVGQPGDAYEQEADRVANEVMRMPEPQVQRQPEEEEELVQPKLVANTEYSIQLQVDEEEEDEEDEEFLLTKELTGHNAEITPDLESSIQAIRGCGQPLPESVRAYFEPRFGRDFSQVRVHTDTRAADSARAVNARAFTTGQDVVFGAGMYDPGTTTGKRLLAHELTHVVQQTGGQVQRKALQETCRAREDLAPIIWPMIQQVILRHPEPPGSEVVQAVWTSIILPGTREERAATAQRKTIQRSIDTQPGFKPVHVRLQTSQLQWDIIQRTLTDDQVTDLAQQVHRLFRARSLDYSALDAILVNETAPHVLQVYQKYETEFGQGSFQRDLSTFVSRIPGHPDQPADQVEAERDSYWDRYAARLYDAGVGIIQRHFHEARSVPVTPANERLWLSHWRTFFASPQGADLEYKPLALWILARWDRIHSVDQISRRGWSPSRSSETYRASFGILSEQPQVNQVGETAGANYWSEIHSHFTTSIGRVVRMIQSYQESYMAAHWAGPLGWNPAAESPEIRPELALAIEDWHSINSRGRLPYANIAGWVSHWMQILRRWRAGNFVSNSLLVRAGVGATVGW